MPCSKVLHYSDALPSSTQLSGGTVWVLGTELTFTRSTELGCVLQGAASPAVHTASDAQCSGESLC